MAYGTTMSYGDTDDHLVWSYSPGGWEINQKYLDEINETLRLDDSRIARLIKAATNTNNGNDWFYINAGDVYLEFAERIFSAGTVARIDTFAYEIANNTKWGDEYYQVYSTDEDGPSEDYSTEDNVRCYVERLINCGIEFGLNRLYNAFEDSDDAEAAIDKVALMPLLAGKILVDA